MTPAAWGVSNASERGAKSELAQDWAGYPHDPRRLGASKRFRAGDKITFHPQVGRVAT